MTAQQQFLIDTIVENMALFLMQDKNISMTDALATIYNSTLYEKIIDTGTGLYYQSARYNYNMLSKELEYGKP